MGAPPCFYFIDFFAIDQFDAAKDLDKLGEIVQSCETVVLLAQPWHQAQSLTRAWCIFELAHAVLGETDLQLIMPAMEKGMFKDAMVKGLKASKDIEAFINVLAKIDSRNMKATKADDLDKIGKFIVERLGGFDKVDLIVSSGLRSWIGKSAVNLCDSFIPPGTADHAWFLRDASGLLYKIGMYEDMLIIVRRSRKIFEDLKNVMGIEFSMTSEAAALSIMGKHDEALRLDKELLEAYIKKFGEIHERTLIKRYNIGVPHMVMKLWDEAEVQFSAALKGFKQLQRAMSPDIRSAQCKLAEVLRDSGKNVQQAKELYKEVLLYEIKGWGPDRPSVLVTQVDYARCLALIGDHSRALTHYRKALPVLLKTYGEIDRDVQNVRMWIKEAENLMSEQ